MAILKHVPVRNSDYGAAQRYLLFEHDEKIKPIHDENGRMIMRSGIIQSGINCDPFTFNTECTELNRAYGKNNGRRDVKAHHFIISFDPKDVTENGLIPAKAHAIAEEYVRKMFAGHQALIVTHTDGHNKSGNVHCHIIINSVRKLNTIYQPFMERPTDTLAGYKHHQTPILLRSQEDELNKICEREHLHTIDFSMPADKKVTDREYRKKLTDFETVKEQMRKAIEEASKEAKSVAEFISILQSRHGITVKETRGVWSYSIAGRDKPIRARMLGRLYGKEAIENRIKGIPDFDTSRPEYKSLPRIFLVHSDLKLVIDIQNCVKAQQSHAYARKVAISNLQQLARSVVYLQNNGINTREELNKMYNNIDAEYKSVAHQLRGIKEQLSSVNETVHFLGQYLSLKKVYSEFMASGNKGAFRNLHGDEIKKYEEALAYLKQHYEHGCFPELKDLKSEKSRILHEQRRLKAAQAGISRSRNDLRITKQNIDKMYSVHDSNLSL